MTVSSRSAPREAAAPGRRERRRSETRTRIFEAAMKLFARQGVVQTTVENITEMADVAKGTFFNYFPSKEAIVGEMARRLMMQLGATAERAQQEPTIWPTLATLPDHILAGPGRSPVLFRSIMGMALLNQPLATLFHEIAAAARGHIASILRRGQELGEVRGDIGADELARTLQQSIWGALVMWSMSEATDARALLGLSFEVFREGIGARPAGRARKEKMS